MSNETVVTESANINTDAPEVTKEEVKTEGELLLNGKGEEEVKTEEPKVEGEEGEKEEETKDDYKFEMPEGFELKEDTLNKFKDIAKELNLSNEHAQKLIDLSTENMKAVIAEQEASWKEINEKWVNEIKTDEEFGGKNFNATLTSANRIIRKYGSDTLVADLKEGFANNPSLIKMLAKIDKAFSEDKMVDGNPPANNLSAADVLWGGINKNTN